MLYAFFYMYIIHICIYISGMLTLRARQGLNSFSGPIECRFAFYSNGTHTSQYDNIIFNGKPHTLSPKLESLTPQPSTLNPQPPTLNPEPSTLNPQPSTPTPEPSTLNPQHQTLNPETLTPETINPETINPETIRPEPSTIKVQTRTS